MSSRSTAEPRTLGALQQLSTEELRSVERYQYHGDPSARRLIRHIIELSKAELQYMGDSEANSLRDFWYNPVKPLLQNAFPERVEDPEFDFSRRMSQYLSAELSEQVKEGRVTYRELNILDDSRQRSLYDSESSIEYDKVLFVEKDSAYRKLKPIGETYELSLVSGSGWQATALIEDLAHELDDGVSYSLYILSDYDPTGFRIARDFSRRAEQLGIDLDTVERIGISPAQVDADTRNAQRFSPPVDTDADERWMAEYGIEGRYGLELEAIGELQTKGEALRRVVVEALEDEIREEDRYQRDLNLATEAMMEQAVINVRQQLVQDLDQHLLREAIDTLRDHDAIKTINTGNQQLNVIADLDRSRTPESSEETSSGEGGILVPEAPNDGTLHEAAVDGSDPSPASENARESLEAWLHKRLQSDAIDIEELLDRSG